MNTKEPHAEIIREFLAAWTRLNMFEAQERDNGGRGCFEAREIPIPACIEVIDWLRYLATGRAQAIKLQDLKSGETLIGNGWFPCMALGMPFLVLIEDSGAFAGAPYVICKDGKHFLNKVELSNGPENLEPTREVFGLVRPIAVGAEQIAEPTAPHAALNNRVTDGDGG